MVNEGVAIIYAPLLKMTIAIEAVFKWFVARFLATRGGGLARRLQAQDGFPVLGAMICKMELKSKQIESKCKGMLRLEGEANSREENPGEASREKSNLEQPNPQ